MFLYIIQHPYANQNTKRALCIKQLKTAVRVLWTTLTKQNLTEIKCKQDVARQLNQGKSKAVLPGRIW